MPAQAAEAITAEFRTQQAELNAVALRDLVKLWPILDWSRLSDTYPAYEAATSTLVALNRERMANLAAGYLHAYRIVSGQDGLAPVELAAPAAARQITTALLVTGPVAFKVARRAGQPVTAAGKTALVTQSGAVSRLVLDAGRQTVMNTVRADPQAKGWQRVTSGSPCAFCAMLASRGAVYSESSADFQAHDHCSCTAEPIYGDDTLTGDALKWDQLYKQVAQGRDDQLNRFRRAYDAAST